MDASNNGSPGLRRTAGLAALGFLLACAVPGAARAQEPDTTVKETLEALEAIDEVLADPGEGLVADEYGRGSPRRSYQGFGVALTEEDYESAVHYLDLRGLPEAADEAAGERLAWILRRLIFEVYTLTAVLETFQASSPSSEGRLDDGLPPAFDPFLSIPSKRGDVDILFERVPREDGVLIWKVSARSLEELPKLWDEEYGYYGLEEVLPRFLFSMSRPLFIQPWQWIGLLLLAMAATLVGWLLGRALRSLLGRFRSELAGQLARFAPAPVGLFFGVLLFSRGMELLRLSLDGQVFVSAGMRFVVAVALTWIAVRVADVAFETLRRRLLRRAGAGLATVTLPTLRRIVQIVVVVVAAILFLDTLGFNVTALVAGLGVGGLAVALAAQRTIENLIGGLTLYADQPVRVGDLCRFGEIFGRVEAIGLRSTRIRTLDRTVVSVPNAEFVNLHLDNFSQRDRIWFHPKIGLRYETTPDQVRYVLVEIRALLYGHPRVDNDGARVRFAGFGDFSLDLEVFAYVLATDYSKFLEVSEDLNLRIMEIVAAAGTSFAFPSLTAYLEQGAPPDLDAAEAARARVQGWRENDELYLPSFPREAIDSLRGSVDYPNAGSPDATRRRGP